MTGWGPRHVQRARKPRGRRMAARRAGARSLRSFLGWRPLLRKRRHQLTLANGPSRTFRTSAQLGCFFGSKRTYSDCAAEVRRLTQRDINRSRDYDAAEALQGAERRRLTALAHLAIIICVL